MSRLLLGSLALGLQVLVFPAPGQESEAVRTVEAYYRDDDAPAIAAARQWIIRGGGALAHYYLGRIHLRHRRPGAAREAFRAGLNAIEDADAPGARRLAARLKRLERLAEGLGAKEEKARRLRAAFSAAASRVGVQLLAAGWREAAVPYLACAATWQDLGAGVEKAMQEHGVAEAVHLQARLRRSRWRTLVPAGRGGWTWLGTATLAEEAAPPDLARGVLHLTPERPAVLHDRDLTARGTLWLTFRVAPGADPSAWRLGVLLRCRSPRDCYRIRLGPESIGLERFVAEPGDPRGDWQVIEAVRHGLRPAARIWHDLVVETGGAAGRVVVHLDGRRVASFQEDAGGMAGRVGLLVENASASVRRMKVTRP